MKHTLPITILLLGLFAASCESNSNHRGTNQSVGSIGHPGLPAAADDDADDADEDVPVNMIPAAVRAAAVNALPGFVITKAERETEDGVELYSLEGNVNGVPKEVEVTTATLKVNVEVADDDDQDADVDDN